MIGAIEKPAAHEHSEATGEAAPAIPLSFQPAGLREAAVAEAAVAEAAVAEAAVPEAAVPGTGAAASGGKLKDPLDVRPVTELDARIQVDCAWSTHM